MNDKIVVELEIYEFELIDTLIGNELRKQGQIAVTALRRIREKIQVAGAPVIAATIAWEQAAKDARQ